MAAGVHRVVAIDGPAASGKSSVARELARRLGFAYLNSGAIYRAITWYLLQRRIDPLDPASIAQTIGSVRIDCRIENNESRVCIDNVDPTNHLRDDAVNRGVSAVSTIPEVRQIATEQMRRCAEEQSLVVEGRDIGSVVFPATPHKFYIDAAPEVRSRRRAAEGLLDEIAARDRVDSSRRASPLVIADDAHVIDTSELSIDEVVDQILARLRNEHLPIARR
ncbi:MAG TPA: (d)CMP kinase [Chthoniobacterales bacterium]